MKTFSLVKSFQTFKNTLLRQGYFDVCGHRRKNFLKKVPGPQKLLILGGLGIANFKFSMNSDSIFPQGLDDENLALDMVKAGQEVMQRSIQNSAQKHSRTGSMASSVKCSKPIINRSGDAVGRVKFYGKDKNGMQNWYKAIWIEYGTKYQGAEPFVRPAIKSGESSVRAAMEKVFNRRAAGGNSRTK